MFKKITFSLFVVLSVAAATWAYFALKEKKQPPVSVINHIPNTAFCIIESKNYSEFISKLTHQNLIWNKVLSNEDISTTQKNLQFLDSLINLHVELKEILDGNPIYWSFIKEKQSTEHLIQFKLKEKNNDSFFADLFQKTFQKDNSIASYDVYTYKFNKQNWLITCEDGIVYISSSINQLQKAISLDVKESIGSNKNYVELIKLNGNQPTHAYFNPQLNTVLSKDVLSKQACFNIDVQLNQINLNGYSFIDSLSFLNTLKNQEADEVALFEKLPNNPAFIKAITISDPKSFYDKLREYNYKQFSINNDDLWNALNDSALYSIQNEFSENIDREIVSANYVINEQMEELTLFKLKDLEKIKPILNLITDSLIKTETTELIKLRSAFSVLLPVFNPLVKYKYAFVKDDHLVLATNLQAITFYQGSVLNADIIGKNNRFMSYARDNLLQDGNYFYYENTDLIRKNNLVSLIQSTELIQTEEAVSHISFVAKNYKNYLQMRINATHSYDQSNQETGHTNVLWSFSADSVIQTPISVFTNHLTKEKELCFQDNANQLYLVSATGNLIWKKTLNESIQSTIYTVDIFKNEKYQLLFNTENYLHLIDRNGNEVEGYPKKMPAKITSNITLLDYDNTKDYRIFVACADRKIYNFSIFGVKTEGFVPVNTEAIVELPIYYTKLGQSDYLTTVDVSGKIYAFSRKGLGRIDFANRTIINPSQLYVSVGNQLSNTKLIYVDDLNNTLNKISFSDTKQSIKLGDELSGYKLAFELIDDDNQPDIIMFGDGGLYGYDLFSTKLFEIFNTSAFYDDAQMVMTTAHNFILAFDKVGQKIDLFTVDGKPSYSIASVTKKPLITQLYNNGNYYVISTNHQQVNCTKLE